MKFTFYANHLRRVFSNIKNLIVNESEHFDWAVSWTHRRAGNSANSSKLDFNRPCVVPHLMERLRTLHTPMTISFRPIISICCLNVACRKTTKLIGLELLLVRIMIRGQEECLVMYSQKLLMHQRTPWQMAANPVYFDI